MQAGTRIVIDSVALLIALVARTDGMTAHAWSGACCRFSAPVHCGCWVCSRIPDSPPSRKTGPRKRRFFARIYQSLDPICGLLTHPWTLLTGYGAGNIINAVWARRGQSRTAAGQSWHERRRGHGIRGRRERDTVRTMRAYTSVIAEYGLIGLAMLVGASMVCMTRGRTVCRGGADGASSDELAHGVCVADVADVADVAGGNSGGGVAGTGFGRIRRLAQDRHLLARPGRIPVHPMRELCVRRSAASCVRRLEGEARA